MSVQLVIPDLGDGSGQARGTITSIAIGVGDYLGVGDSFLELETDKVTMEVPADRAGVVTSVLVRVGEEVRPGQACVELEDGAGSGEGSVMQPDLGNVRRGDVPTYAAKDHDPAGQASREGITVMSNVVAGIGQARVVPAGPSTRRLARELGMDIRILNGTGPAGQITPQDVKAEACRLLVMQGRSDPGVTGGLDPLPDAGKHGEVWRRVLTGMERVTAANMARAWRHVPHAWMEESADVTELDDWRRRHGTCVRELGGNLTLTVLIAKAVACALKDFPKLNCVIDESSQEIVFRKYFNIGIAVDTDYGLVVPTVRDADKKGLAALAREMTLLTQKAHDRKLLPGEMDGAGFTISNLGGRGLERILPVVNWPQVAILGVATARDIPVCREGSIVPRKMLPMTLGFDHRVINGAEGARFIVKVRELLEDPRSMLI